MPLRKMTLFQPQHWCATCEKRYSGAFRIYTRGDIIMTRYQKRCMLSVYARGKSLIEFCSEACAANEPYTYSAAASNLMTQTFDSAPVHALHEDLFYVQMELDVSRATMRDILAQLDNGVISEEAMRGFDVPKLAAAQAEMQRLLDEMVVE